MFLLFLINGLAFFAAGLAIVLESRKENFFASGSALRLLAAWAFLGCLANFTQMVMSIQQPSTPDTMLINLSALRLILLLLGPICLFLFGGNLVAVATGYKWLHWIGVGLVSAWLAALLFRFPASGELSLGWMSAAEILTRNLIYLPALGMSALGAALQARRFRQMNMKVVAADSVSASAAFALKAIVSGAIGLPTPALYPTALVGVAGLVAYVAPVQLARTVTTVGIAWFVIRIVRFLESDRRQQMDAAIQQRLQSQQQAREDVERWSKGLGRLMDAVSSAIGGPLSLPEILAVALREVLSLSGFDAGEVFLVDETRRKLIFVSQQGMPDVVEKCEHAFPVATSGLEDVPGLKDIVVVSRLQDDPSLQGKPCYEAGFTTVARVPVKYRGTTLGAMNLFSRSERNLEADEASVLVAVAQQMGVAIENSRLYTEVQNIAVLQERSRLSRELHDGLAQVLGYLHLKSKVVEQLLVAGNLARAQVEVSEIRQTAGRAYEDVRESILGLRTTVTPGVGLVPAVKEYTRRFEEQSGIVVNLMVSEQARVAFAPEVEVQLLRIMQEALTNARKHSGARRVWVRFESDGDSDSIIIEDDGRGFDMAEVGQDGVRHFGLQTMEERARSVGGILRIQTELGAGTMVIVQLPRAA